MKKLLVMIMAALLLVCSVVMVGCGSVTGTYKFDSMSGEEAGLEVNVKAGDEFMGVTVSEDFIVLDIKADGTCSMTSSGVTVDGTWKKEDDKVVIEVGGGKSSWTHKGNKLTQTKGGLTTVLSK